MSPTRQDQHGRRRSALGAWCFALVLTLASVADVHAQPRNFDELVRAAVEEYNAGNWAEARVLFGRAHALRPSARTFRGMGLADYERRNYVAAIAELEAALTSANKPLPQAQRESTERALAQARLYVASYRIAVAGGVRELFVDAQRVELADDGWLVLNPGHHTLTVKSGAGATIEREIVAEAGARGELVLESNASVSDTSAVSRAARSRGATSSAAPRPATDGQGGLMWTWVAAGTTVAFGAGSAIFGGLALDKNDEFRQLRADCPGARCQTERMADAKSQGQDYQLLTNVGFGLTAAAAAATVVFYLVESRSPDERTGAAMVAGPGQVGIGGRF